MRADSSGSPLAKFLALMSAARAGSQAPRARPARRRSAARADNQRGAKTDVLAIVDLHRIALAYVTNKKGGDQIMDALDAAVGPATGPSGIPMERFDSRLISGGVDMKDIQTVMGDAERSFAGETIRPWIDQRPQHRRDLRDQPRRRR